MRLLLLSKSQPLRWVAIWHCVRTGKPQHLYSCDGPARRKRHIACGGLFHFIVKLIARLFCFFPPSCRAENLIAI